MLANRPCHTPCAARVVRRRGVPCRLPRAAIVLCVLSLLLFGSGLARYGALMDAFAGTSTFTLASGVSREEIDAVERANDSLDAPVPFVVWTLDDGTAVGRTADPSAEATHVTTARLDAEGFPVLAGDLAAKLGLDGELRDYRLLALIAHGCLLLYPLVLATWLLPACRRTAGYRSAPRAAQALPYVLPAIVALAATAVLCATVSSFGEFFPTRWSDFGAWQEALRTAEAHLSVLALSPVPGDGPVVSAFAETVFCALAAATILIAGLWAFERWLVRGRARHARLGRGRRIEHDARLRAADGSNHDVS